MTGNEVLIPEHLIRRWTETREKPSTDPMHIGKEIVYCSAVVEEIQQWLQDNPRFRGGRRRHWYDPVAYFVLCPSQEDEILFRMTFDIHD